VTRGIVHLVGAGPGDPDLLTVRAVKCLRAAEVVAYDELVSPAILALASPDAELLAVGRRHGAGTTSYRLHPEVMARAAAGKIVVRLKAGDPLVFGRGGEEAEELAEAGIAFSIVPGISSALGAAAYAGIPLTHRLHASRVTFATGHDADDRHASRLPDAAREGTPPPGGTLVLFMASRKLDANVARLVAAGWSTETPAAYVASATTPEQVVVTGTLGNLAGRAAHLPRSAPAIVIVGDVVTVRARLRTLGASWAPAGSGLDALDALDALATRRSA
jgi:uroporphyrinogen III methyltransferase/synthase